MFIVRPRKCISYSSVLQRHAGRIPRRIQALYSAVLKFSSSSSSSSGCQGWPNLTSRNRAAIPVICFSLNISSLPISRCFEIHASERPISCSSLIILLIKSASYDPLAQLCRMVLAIWLDKGLSITDTGSIPCSLS